MYVVIYPLDSALHPLGLAVNNITRMQTNILLVEDTVERQQSLVSAYSTITKSVLYLLLALFFIFLKMST